MVVIGSNCCTRHREHKIQSQGVVDAIDNNSAARIAKRHRVTVRQSSPWIDEHPCLPAQDRESDWFQRMKPVLALYPCSSEGVCELSLVSLQQEREPGGNRMPTHKRPGLTDQIRENAEHPDKFQGQFCSLENGKGSHKRSIQHKSAVAKR